MNATRGHSCRLLCLIAVAMEAAYAVIHLGRTNEERILWMLVAYAVCGASWGWLVWRGGRAYSFGPKAVGNAGHCSDQNIPVAERINTNSRGMLVLVFIAGLVFRATLFPLTPSASQDVRRYLWEGLVQQASFSPYEHAPNAEALQPLARQHADLHQRINHHDLAAIYPPVAQLLFRANAALFGGSLFGWKLILLAFDLFLVATVLMMLRGRGVAVLGLIGVWWCPLLLFETYEGGHLDLIGAALLAFAVFAMLRGRPAVAAVALGLAVNVKYIWPALAGVLLLGALTSWRRRAVFALIAGLTAAICWMPYVRELPSAVATARIFAEHWTFNDPIFEYMRRLPGPRWLPLSLILAGLTGMALYLNRKSRGRDLWQDVWLLNGTALLTGPVAYPWYFLWIVPGLAFRPPAWLLLWIFCVPALHVVDWHYVRTGAWDAMPWLWWMVDAAPLVLLLWAWRTRTGNLPMATR